MNKVVEVHIDQELCEEINSMLADRGVAIQQGAHNLCFVLANQMVVSGFTDQEIMSDCRDIGGLIFGLAMALRRYGVEDHGVHAPQGPIN